MEKSLVLFVHGLSGTPFKTWAKFPDLISSDGELALKYNVSLDEYPAVPTFNPLKRSGHLELAADGLGTRIDNIHLNYKSIAIIAHSQGGLIALRYILNCTERQHFLPVTHLVAFATPFNGASLAAWGKVLGEQVEDLDPASRFMYQLRKDWERLRGKLKVRIRAIIGGMDALVAPSSAISVDSNHQTIHGCDHFNIVKPSSSQDESFLCAKRFLLSPSQQLIQAAEIRKPLVIAEGDRRKIAKLLEELVSMPASNTWQSEWDLGRTQFQTEVTNALDGASPETWRSASRYGRNLRKSIRQDVMDRDAMPFYVDKLSECTDAIDDMLENSGGDAINIIPPEQEELLSRIERLEKEVSEERGRLEQRRKFAEHSGSAEHQIQLLTERLGHVEIKLAASREKVAQTEQVDLKLSDTSLIITLIRDSLQSLKAGVELLNDIRFSETLRKTAKAAWLMGKRYAAALQRRFATLKLAWRQEEIFEEFDQHQLSFGLEDEVVSALSELKNSAGSTNVSRSSQIMEYAQAGIFEVSLDLLMVHARELKSEFVPECEKLILDYKLLNKSATDVAFQEMKIGLSGEIHELVNKIERESNIDTYDGISENPFTRYTADVGISEAIAYLATREWNMRTSRHVDFTLEYIQLHYAISAGSVPMWGKVTPARTLEPIPSNFWRFNKIDYESVFSTDAITRYDDDLRGRRLDSSRKRADAVFVNLWTNREAIESLYRRQDEKISRLRKIIRAVDDLVKRSELQEKRFKGTDVDQPSARRLLESWQHNVLAIFRDIDVPPEEIDRFNKAIYIHPGLDLSDLDMEQIREVWSSAVKILREIIFKCKAKLMDNFREELT